MKRTLRRQASAFALVLGLFVLIFSMALVALPGIVRSVRISANSTDLEMVFQIAEAGVEAGIRKLTTDKQYRGIFTSAFAGGSYTVTISTLTGTPQIEIKSVATFASFTRIVTMIVDTADASALNPFHYALFAGGHAYLTDDIDSPGYVTNSINEKAVHTNRQAAITNVTLGTILTQAEKGDPVYPLPVIDWAGLKARADVIHSGDLTIDNKNEANYTSRVLYVTGNLTIDLFVAADDPDQSIVDLSSTCLVAEGNITVSGGPYRLVMTPKGTEKLPILIAGGRIDFQNTAARQTAWTVTLKGTSYTLDDKTGPPQLIGAVYAQTAIDIDHVVLKGTLHTAGDLWLRHDCQVTYFKYFSILPRMLMLPGGGIRTVAWK